MNLFSPENKESTERYRESKILNPDTEQHLIDRVAQGFESFPDAPTCPITTCRNPLRIDVRDAYILITCSNCTFEKKLKRNTDK